MKIRVTSSRGCEQTRDYDSFKRYGAETSQHRTFA
jgi:hypothetical protein